MNTNHVYIISALSVLFLSGAIDDIKHTSPVSRLVIQILAASLLVVGGDVHVNSLGFLWPESEIFLNDWANLFTIAAIVTAINAFNMVDGIDGLASGLGLIALGSVLYLSINALNILFLTSLILGVSLAVFLAFNLGLFGVKRKVFLGDAGSTFLGLICAWLLIESSNNASHNLTPIGVVFILMVPLLDVFSVILGRLLNGLSALKADQNHIHHLLLFLGLSTKTALTVILILALFFTWLGIYHLQFGISESSMFFLFIFLLIFQTILVYKIIKIRLRSSH
jgi:UDP-GlcNAc:undecaprenyl-phosphate/decaprenyl-phosphate GlcNAc-1-phosphate transferase